MQTEQSITPAAEWEAVFEAAARGETKPVDELMFARMSGDYELTPMESLAIHQIRQFADASKDLLKATHDLEADALRVRRAVEGGNHVNALGELQSRAQRFDMLCALRQERLESAKAIIRRFAD